MTVVQSLMTWGALMLLPQTDCFIACGDVMVSALFHDATQLKDVWHNYKNIQLP